MQHNISFPTALMPEETFFNVVREAPPYELAVSPRSKIHREVGLQYEEHIIMLN